MQENYKNLTVWLCFSPEDDHKDWVSKFRHFLDVLLTQILSQKPIFILNLEEKPMDEIEACVVILSPNFVEDMTLQKQLVNFISHKNAVDNEKQQIFCVAKNPVEQGYLPDFLQKIWTYKLYKIEEKTQAVEEFEDFFNVEAQRYYWIQLTSLAREMSNLSDNQQYTSSVESKNLSVYLAETTPDLYIYRHILQRELKRYGVKVLPQNPIATHQNISMIEAQVFRNLQKSAFSVHLIGQEYGENIANTEYSLIDWQNRWAESHSTQQRNEEKSFRRYIWIPTFLKEINPSQQQFLEELKQASLLNEEEEILQIPLEDLKATLRKTLKNKDLILKKNYIIEKDRHTIAQHHFSTYLIGHKVDNLSIQTLKQTLTNLEAEVQESMQQGTVLDMRQHHLQCLRECEVALIFFEHADTNWLKMKWLDLAKAPGLGRKKPLRFKFVVSPLQPSVIHNILGQNTPIISITPETQEDVLKTFWQTLLQE